MGNIDIDWVEINVILEKSTLSKHVTNTPLTFINGITPEEKEKIEFLRNIAFRAGWDYYRRRSAGFPRTVYYFICAYLEKRYPELSQKSRDVLAADACCCMR